MPDREDHSDDPTKPQVGEPYEPSSHGTPMDQLTAHLDRGWDLVARGELAQATLSAQQVLAIDDEAPEGYTLMGAIRAAAGDHDEAMAHFREAMELDPDYLDPILYAAELALHPRGDADECIRLCDEALELLGEADKDEQVDALLLKVDAFLLKGETEQARKAISLLPQGPYGQPELHLRAGRSLFDLGMIQEAEGHLTQAIEREPRLSDAHYHLALIHEERGRLLDMVRAFRKVRDLDLEEPQPPWALSEPAFETLVERVVGALPERIKTLLGRAPVVVADYPALELIVEGYDPRMAIFITEGPTLLDQEGDHAPGHAHGQGHGHAHGHEPASRSNGHKNGKNGHRNGKAHGSDAPPSLSAEGLARIDDGSPRVGCVFLYRRNLQRSVSSIDALEPEVRFVLVHELGHFYGFSDEEMDALDLS